MSIRKVYNSHRPYYEVTNKSGTKVLGKHSTKKKALRQLAAIEASMARRKK